MLHDSPDSPQEMGALRPYFVCRVGGLPVDRVEALATPALLELSTASLSLDDQLETAEQRASDTLYRRIGQTEDRRIRGQLLELRRALHNGRKVDWEKLQEALGEDLPMVREVISLRDAREAAAAAVSEAHAQGQAQARGALRELLRDEAFRRGLLLSSPSLHRALDRYLESGGKLDSRREKTERGLLRYLTRAAMKATPFATFCAVLPGRVTGPSEVAAGELRFTGDPRRKRSVARLNKGLQAALLEHLRGVAEVRRHLAVETNPTLRVVNGHWCFLSSLRGREVFQRVGANPVLERITRCFRGRPSLPLEELVRAVCTDPEIEAMPEEAMTFLNGLVEVGFLRFRTGIREQEADWDVPLAELLEQIPERPARRAAILLRGLRELLERYAAAMIGERAELLDQMRTMQQETFEALELRRPPRRNLQLYEDATADAEVRIGLHGGFATAIEELQDFVRCTLPLGYPRSEMAGMRRFFDLHYGSEVASVPLLDFYEIYYRQHFKAHLEKEAGRRAGVRAAELDGYDVTNPFGLEVVARIRSASDRIQSLLRRRWAEAPEAEEIRIRPSELEEALDGVDGLNGACRSVSVFAQAVPGDRPALLLQGASYMAGYGKFFSRFLYLFPPEMHRAVLEDNEALSEDLLAEICGDADFNANLHPPLLRWEISYPTGESGIAEEQLPSPELKVERDPRDPHRLCLVHAPTGRRVLPLDLGFLNPRMRPPLFQLLSRFAPVGQYGLPLPDRPAVRGVAPATAAVASEPQVVHRPRIRYGEHLVLSRRQWRVPGALFPASRAGEEAAEYFLRVQRWRRDHGIPEECYVRVLPESVGSGRRQHTPTAARGEEEEQSEGRTNEEQQEERSVVEVDAALPEMQAARADSAEAPALSRDGAGGAAAASRAAVRPRTAGSRDLRKPQYIDFRNPLLVALFGRLATRVVAFSVVVEERYPRPEDLSEHAGLRYATELVFQLDFPSGSLRDNVAPSVAELAHA